MTAECNYFYIEKAIYYLIAEDKLAAVEHIVSY